MAGLLIDVISIDRPEPCAIDYPTKGGDPLQTFVRVIRGEILPIRFEPYPEPPHLAVAPLAGQVDALPMQQRVTAVRLLSSGVASTFPRLAPQVLPWRMSLELWERGMFAQAGIPWPPLP